MRATILIRTKRIIKAYRDWIRPGSRVLDIGCGNGVVSEQLQKSMDLKMTGTDILPYVECDMPFRVMEEASRLPFADREFEVALITDSLHHCESRSVQEQLVLEAGRVAQRVIVFESKGTWLVRVWDQVINRIHNPLMPVPLHFRSLEEWNTVFGELGFRTKATEIPGSWSYPMTHFAFCLDPV